MVPKPNLIQQKKRCYYYINEQTQVLLPKKNLNNFFFLISKGNFIQELNNESPEYTRSIQPGTNIIKYINYKHPSNHRPKK